jgi:hypothetical protein
MSSGSQLVPGVTRPAQPPPRNSLQSSPRAKSHDATIREEFHRYQAQRVNIYSETIGYGPELPGRVPGGRDARADIDELPNPCLPGQEPHRPLHERPIGRRHGMYLRENAQDLADGLPVSGTVILATQEVITDSASNHRSAG